MHCNQRKTHEEIINYYSVKQQHATLVMQLMITVNFQTTPCLKKCAKLFLSELRQISTNYENFWHKNAKEDILM